MDPVREEEELLDRVRRHLAALRPSRPPPIAHYEAQMIDLRDQIAVAQLEDVPALEQQMERLSGIAARRAAAVVDPVDPASPYFGHLKLRESERGVRDVLIGRTTHIDARAGVRIVDWRHAPISQLYYRYEEGSDYEETFGEREVEGTVLARRTVTIDGGVLLRVSCPETTFVKRDGAWVAMTARQTSLAGGQGTAVRPSDMKGALGTGAAFAGREDRHLPEIAALLDKRQFELISRPDSGLVVIQGGAGSGKTTIGVHRMAFLAYNAPQRFSPDKMLVVVGSPGLRAYISEVLPALGIAGVMVETFAEWARAARIRAIPWLDAPLEESTPSVVTRYKTHPVILRLLEKRAQELLADAKTRRDSRGVMWLWADVLTDLDRVLAAFAASPDPELPVPQIKRAWRWCADRCPAILDLDKGDRAERKAAMADEPPGDDDHTRGVDDRDEGDERATLDPEDDALLLRGYQLLVGELRRGKAHPGAPQRAPLVYEHLFVDEAQDLAPVDLKVLVGVVSKQRSITLAGDTAQRLHMDSGFRDWRAVLEDLGLSHVVVEPLRIAYRSTREVLQFARDVLGPLADPVPPEAPRTGAPVEHHAFPSPGAAVAFLADAMRPLFVREPRATLAVLSRHPEQADLYFEALARAEIPNLRRVRSYDFAFKPGAEVTEIRQVKGLEYDYVVLVDVNAGTFPADDESRHLLHIGATRAAHQLWVVSTGPMSPLLPAWLR